MSQAGGGAAPDLTRALAEEVHALRFEDLSARDRAQLERLVLDHLAICYRGALLPWGRALRTWAAAYRGAGRARLFADEARVAAPVAALVNATAAHGLELDDTHD